MKLRGKIANYVNGEIQDLTEKTSNTDHWTSVSGLEIF